MTDEQIDQLYADCARELGTVGEERAGLYLARLALLLMLEVDDPARVSQAIRAAREGL